VTTAPILELRGITKEFPGIVANDHVDFDLAPGEGPRTARRERRRQVDADEHPLRPVQGRLRRDPPERQAGHVRICKGCDRRRNRDGAPALHADPGDDRGREHRARQRADTRRDLSRRGRCGAAGARALGAVRARGRPDGPRLADHRRTAAAGRDPEGALSRRRDPDPGRADGRADAAGGDRALRDHQEPARGRQVDHLHQPQAERGARDRRPDHRPAAR